ncbi:prepilin peptidase [Candidatus Woesearchaeota archaeon]|nr:prepilin peptidase [Candidatus Woesearchaeota archaeon]
MDPNTILHSIAFLALLVGTYTDFKIREVPDWINYALIMTGFGLRLIFSVINQDWSYIIAGVLGFAIFLGLALIMFYAGQWGGGDAKMLMGLGSLLGFEFKLDSFMAGFTINTLIFGALFGLGFSAYLAARKRQSFFSEFTNLYVNKRRQKLLTWTASAALLLAALWVDPTWRIFLILLGGMIFFSFYIFIFLHAVENCCMLKEVEPEKLTEGDWIVNDIIVGGKRIAGPKDLGVSIEQIKKLITLKKKKKIKNVLIKEGIPFVPSFLMGFIVTTLWGNWLFAMLGLL